MIERIRRHPVSHIVGGLFILLGIALTAGFAYQLYSDPALLPKINWKTLAALLIGGFAPIFVGGVLWSKWGNAVDVFLNTAKKVDPSS